MNEKKIILQLIADGCNRPEHLAKETNTTPLRVNKIIGDLESLGYVHAQKNNVLDLKNGFLKVTITPAGFIYLKNELSKSIINMN